MTPQETFKQYEDLINLHDFDLLAPMIADDATFWFSEGTFVGLASIRGAFERTWANLANERYGLTDLRWIAVGDVAAGCTYQFNWESEGNGQTMSGRGRGTTMLRRDAEGWRIVHEHLSGIPA